MPNKSVQPQILALMQTAPFVTVPIIAKWFYTEDWLVDYDRAYNKASGVLYGMAKYGKIKKVVKVIGGRRTAFYIPLWNQGEKPKGLGYMVLQHNIGTVDALTGFFIRGSNIQWGGKGAPDGVVSMRFAFETDCDTRTNLKDIEAQGNKYEEEYAEYEKVLWMSYPTNTDYLADLYDQDLQYPQSKRLREKFKQFDFSKELKEKFLFSTFAKVADPKIDPLKDLVWQNMKGSNRRVIQ